MEFKTILDPKAASPTDCAIAGVFEKGEMGTAARLLDKRTNGLISEVCGRGDFPGKLADTLLLPVAGTNGLRRLLLVGLGPKAGYNRKAFRKAVQSAAQTLGKTGTESAVLYLALDPVPELDFAYRARFVAELFVGQLYRIPDLKSAPKPPAAKLSSVAVACADARSGKLAAAALKIGEAIGAGTTFSRNLANLPPNVCTPRYLAARAQDLQKGCKNVRTTIHDETAIKNFKMGCFLAVTRGSEEPPRLIVVDYRGGRKGEAPICLIGKGITFDSGGISLKDPPGMDEMKFDMTGAAAVLGTIKAAADLQLPLNLVGVVAACENLPSGRAVKPSDIVTSMSGQTVEILNTDAEGRLILCDAITFSRRFKPAAIVDVATLTGACVVALGAPHSGLMGNDDRLARELEQAGLRSDDKAWRLPVSEDYAEQLKSNFADFANVGSRDGGASTAASFLWKFTQDLRWAHLDIAGTAWLGGANKGSTGRPVSLLVDFLVHRAAPR